MGNVTSQSPSAPTDTCDARSVANLLLDLAAEAGVSLTNLSLQKLIYFAHGVMLSKHGQPLVEGYFEAWEYGPVHPLVYDAFKAAGRAPIACRATRRDLRTGYSMELLRPTGAAGTVVKDVFDAIGRQSPGRLVALSHADGGPWHETVNKTGTGSRLGLRISDRVICDRFHRHLLVVGSSKDRIGETVDESPPA